MTENKYSAQERYEKKNGITVKSFKIKHDLADEFRVACKRVGESQASVISKLMREFIEQHKEQ